MIWAGLLNDDFGVVNKSILSHVGVSVPWLFDANWARVSVVLVSVWLTTPYFFLVSLGALQSIPAELTEAARVDGGGAFAVFRRVTLPLLLIVVGPLLIASFAFNFNNFSNVYLLTGGGPYTGDVIRSRGRPISSSPTRTSSRSPPGKGNDYALASAVSSSSSSSSRSISGIAFYRTKAFENLA